jgi:hypothetical protein
MRHSDNKLSKQRPAIDLGRLRTVIDELVAQAFDVDIAALRGPTRGVAPTALARQVAMYLARVSRNLTCTQVGAMFARDRTTVGYACHLIEQRRDDPRFDLEIERLECLLAILIDGIGLSDPDPDDEPRPFTDRCSKGPKP